MRVRAVPWPGMTSRRRRFVVALVAAPLLAACDQGGGSLRGQWLLASDCKRIGQAQRYEPFEMDLAFASVTEQQGAALIRLSPSARRIELSDQIAIALERAPAVREEARSLGAMVLTLEPDASGDADLGLILLGRCAHATQPIGAKGTLTFFDYGWRQGSRLRGEMAFDLFDRRSGELVGEGFVGEFDFETITGLPYTAFEPKDY
jgi:hypothetical protein